MTLQSLPTSTWLFWLAGAVAIPVGLVASCSTGGGGVISGTGSASTASTSSDPKGTSTTPATASSRGSSLAINVCGEAGCAVTPGDNECDGGVTYTIIGSHEPLLPPKHVTQANASESEDPCNQVIEWSAPDAEPPVVWKPPTTEDYSCPEGSIRVHVRDIWSKEAEPSLGTLPKRPFAVQLIQSPSWAPTAARADSKGCDWYSVCAPQPYLSKFRLGAMGTDSCSAPQGNSGEFDIAEFAGKSDVWIDYTGSSSSLQADYNTASGGFRVTADKSDVESLLCPPGEPDNSVPEGYTKLHIRWLWGDPSKTGFPGTGCEQIEMGMTTPPYPTTLKIQAAGTCSNMQAMLELQNGHCPWYSALVPNDQWVEGGQLDIWYMGSTDNQVFATGAKLPKRTKDEYWLAYAGPPDNINWSGQGTVCLNYSNKKESYRFYEQNPGPGYQGCGGSGDVTFDPCNPLAPSGYHAVHFRYMWAGQKIFTFFPSLDLMPKWIILELVGDAGGENVTCTREADRPWFNCQVPDKYFAPGTTWRADDKTITDGRTEWNTVTHRPFPEKPGEYWIRWYYGKPDYNGEFKAFDYYPDAVGGDWAATGDWNDEACADKPPATTPTLGYDGWFPYDETGYGYPNGITLAATYPEPKKVQQLFNYLVQERYEIWKKNYVLEGAANACSDGAARVKTDPPETVSEGQGYGLAMAAAIGDKETTGKLWKFVRHYLGQDAKKYCGGLMGWMWQGPQDCRPLDEPCDPDTGCGGNGDSAFDGDVDIAIGLVYAAMQWPADYKQAAIDWLLKMECELNAVYEPPWVFGGKGDTADKNCAQYEPGNPNSKPCSYTPGADGATFINYYPPGYFRVFGDFLKAQLDPDTNSEDEREAHRKLWYKAAESVYEQLERCYDEGGVHPALTTDNGTWSAPCSSMVDNYNWARYLWRVGVDAAWFGNRTDLPENQPNSSSHYEPKSRMQAKIDLIQDFFSNFHVKNPVEPNANRFSTLCDRLQPDGEITGCDPGFGHNSYFVGTMASAYVSVFDNDGKTTSGIRREAIEEAISSAIMNDKYYQESIGVYTMMFLTGNFPNPLVVEK